FYVDAKNPESVGRLWRAFEAAEPGKVKGKSSHLVDLIALVRHAIGSPTPLVPFAAVVEDRYRQWLADKAKAGNTFKPEQEKWLGAIKDHIATSLAIDTDALEDVPFRQWGGLGAAHEVFGDSLPTILSELNERLV